MNISKYISRLLLMSPELPLTPSLPTTQIKQQTAPQAAESTLKRSNKVVEKDAKAKLASNNSEARMSEKIEVSGWKIWSYDPLRLIRTQQTESDFESKLFGQSVKGKAFKKLIFDKRSHKKIDIHGHHHRAVGKHHKHLHAKVLHQPKR